MALSIVERVIGDGSLLVCAGLLMLLAFIFWWMGIFTSLPDSALRGLLALLAYVLTFTFLTSHNARYAAVFLSFGAAALTWFFVYNVEHTVTLIGGVALVAALSLAIGDDVTMNAVFLGCAAAAVGILCLYRVKVVSGLKAIFSSLLFTWILVYTFLYFYSSKAHKFDNSLEQIQYLFGSLDSDEGRTHRIVVVATAGFRVAMIFGVWYYYHYKNSKKEAAVQRLVDKEKRKKERKAKERRSSRSKSKSKSTSKKKHKRADTSTEESTSSVPDDASEDDDETLNEETDHVLQEIGMAVKTDGSGGGAAAAAAAAVSEEEEEDEEDTADEGEVPTSAEQRV